MVNAAAEQKRAGTPAQQRPRLLRRRFQVALALAVAFAVLQVGLASKPAKEPALPPRPPETAAQTEVRGILTMLHGDWVLANYSYLADLSEQERDRHWHVLARMLASPDDPLFREAVRLAVLERQVALVPMLRSALDGADEGTRRVLVESIEKLEPWGDGELADLLESSSPGIVAGALAIAAARTDRPLERIVEHLADADAAIRAAALAALPRTLPAELAARILAAVRQAPTEQAGQALAALARCPASPETEAVLYQQIEQQTEHCGLVLDALAARALPLARPDAVHRLVVDGTLPVLARARALHCLEATGSLARVQEFEQVRLHHPVLEYFAARALLRDGRTSAVEQLLDVLRAPDDSYDEADARSVQEARLGARQILAALANTGIYAGLAEWEEWAGRHPPLRLGILPAPTVVFD